VLIAFFFFQLESQVFMRNDLSHGF